mmetsp:Transcript_99059/g.212195  ORF Transcript_99059/g.212195 Transcript_99059/m.212195 type:complete len:662 (+) Transcript_99059:80-2065(+)
MRCGPAARFLAASVTACVLAALLEGCSSGGLRGEAENDDADEFMKVEGVSNTTTTSPTLTPVPTPVPTDGSSGGLISNSTAMTTTTTATPIPTPAPTPAPNAAADPIWEVVATDQACDSSPLGGLFGNNALGIIASREVCQEWCASRSNCNFYLWKDDQHAQMRYHCAFWETCGSRHAYSDGHGGRIYQKIHQTPAPTSAPANGSSGDQLVPTPAKTTATTTTSTSTPALAPGPIGGGSGAQPACAELTSEGLAAIIEVKRLQLPAPLRGSCPHFGIATSCRHAFYAASASTGYHAVLYNDASDVAQLLLLNTEDSLVKAQVMGKEEVRGLQFDVEHLVVLLSGGTGQYESPSVVVKLQLPDLTEVWRHSLESPMVGLEAWTPDNSDSLAVSPSRYVMHAAGVCRPGKWCEGHQGDITQVLDAATGQQIPAEGHDWQASHSCKQMIGYNNDSDTFLLANAGDAYPKGLVFSTFRGGQHRKTETFAGWGNGGGRQGVTQGAIKPAFEGGGFGAVWSYAQNEHALDRLHFATFDDNGNFVQSPKEVFPGSSSIQIGVNLVPLSGERWLVAYTESTQDVLSDYLKIYWDNWGVPDDVREQGGRLVILDGNGSMQGQSVDVAALGAHFPVEVNHLLERSDGFGWAYMEGVGADHVKIVRLRCSRS